MTTVDEVSDETKVSDEFILRSVAFRGYWRILCDSSEHFSGIVVVTLPTTYFEQ